MTHMALAHPQFGPAIVKGTPISRADTVEDTSNALLYLASDASSFMTGQHLVVDGGATC